MVKFGDNIIDEDGNPQVFEWGWHSPNTCIFLPDIRWYQENIPEFDSSTYHFIPDGNTWILKLWKPYSHSESFYGKTWEQCFCKMYLKEVHNKEA